ncbi:AAA family ATPase [Porphyromonas sp.]|uniref:AAA family ATPase n=1 Tax=Porphyromonas sp. TaxID=1924944 RepID=UPI003AB84687
MRYLEIRSLGPVAKTELMEITSVTLFCGRQGSGKSTIVKVLSSCIWLEKSIVKQEVSEKHYTLYNRFRNNLCAYHQIEDFFGPDTYIKYVGDAYTFEYKEERLYISKRRSDGEYLLPKVMYIPAERNFMVAIEQAEKVRNLPPSLVTLQEEYLKALGSMKEPFPLLDGFAIEYNKQNKIAYIVKDKSKVRAHKGASGLQSLLPLLLVSSYLSSSISNGPTTTLSADERATLRKKIERIQEDSSLSDHLKKIIIEDLSKVITPRCIWCIVEEPEQNLYPLSQKEVLLALLRNRQNSRGSGLVMTTHSPYIINYLSICVKAHQVAHGASPDIIAKVEKIIPQASLLAPQDLSIYEIDEDGSVKKLETYDGIPTDSNFLNNALAETNDLYGDLMDIEDDANK